MTRSRHSHLRTELIRIHQRGKHKSDIKNKTTIAKISTRKTNSQHIHTLIFLLSPFCVLFLILRFQKKNKKKNTHDPYFKQKMYPGLFSSIWDAMQIETRALRHDTLALDEQQAVLAYLKSNAVLVPCPGCKYHALSYLASHPVDGIKTGEDAFRWVIDFHNEVNRRNGKREYTYKEAEDSLVARLDRDFKGLPKAELIQKESHKKIKELEEELRTFKNIPHAVTNERLSVYIIIAMVASLLVLLLLLILFVAFMKISRKIQGFEKAFVTNAL